MSDESIELRLENPNYNDENDKKIKLDLSEYESVYIMYGSDLRGLDIKFKKGGEVIFGLNENPWGDEGNIKGIPEDLTMLGEVTFYNVDSAPVKLGKESSLHISGTMPSKLDTSPCAEISLSNLTLDKDIGSSNLRDLRLDNVDVATVNLDVSSVESFFAQRTSFNKDLELTFKSGAEDITFHDCREEMPKKITANDCEFIRLSSHDLSNVKSMDYSAKELYCLGVRAFPSNFKFDKAETVDLASCNLSNTNLSFADNSCVSMSNIISLSPSQSTLDFSNCKDVKISDIKSGTFDRRDKYIYLPNKDNVKQLQQELTAKGLPSGNVYFGKPLGLCKGKPNTRQ